MTRQLLASAAIGAGLLAVAACGTQANQADIQTLLAGGQRAAQAGQLAECIQKYTEAIGQSPDTVTAYIGRAGCYLTGGDAAAAVQDYDKAIALSPRDPSLYLQRAQAEQDIGNRTKASDDYRKLGEFGSASPEQLVIAADGLAQMSFYPDALSLLDLGLKTYSNNWNLHRARADVEVALGNDAEGLREFQLAVNLARGTALAQVLSDRGSYYRTHQQPQLAVKDYSGAIRIDPTDYKLFRGRAESLRQLGDFKGAEADLGNAIRQYQLVSLLDPDILAELFLDRGRLYAEQALKDKALADYRQALAVSRPTNALQRASIQKLIADVSG